MLFWERWFALSKCMFARGYAGHVEACTPMAFGPVGTSFRTLALRPSSFTLAGEYVEAFLA